MQKELTLGKLANGAPFRVPLNFLMHTTAIIGQRGSGKTAAATVIAEEFCEAGLPFVSIDPVGVWWGLRAKPDGSPGGYSVVVFGGQHGDLPLLKDGGRALADAIMQKNISCIIDMSGESKNTVRHFVGEFCDRSMELQPEVGRHFFIEEAPELVPQRAMGEQQRAKAAVDRLWRLGRNVGYGGSLISQRYATIDKDVLTQSENLLSFRVIGKTDRDACEAWISEVVQETESEKKAAAFMKSLTTLDPGEGWFWSPQWLGRFEKIQMRHRKTFHPGATRSVGEKNVTRVSLANVDEFVDEFKQTLAKKKPEATTFDLARKPAKKQGTIDEFDKHSAGLDKNARRGSVDFSPPPEIAELTRLRRDLDARTRELAAMRLVLTRTREVFRPQYTALFQLYGDLDTLPGMTPAQTPANRPGVAPLGQHVDAPAGMEVYEPYRPKLPGKRWQILETLVRFGGEMKRVALGASLGATVGGTTYRQYLSQLSALGLIEKSGDTIRLVRI